MAIYLDNSATTPVDPAVFDAMKPYLTEKFANPSSIHILGRAVREDVEDARRTVAASISASSDEIVFTASGTESDNMAVKGMALALQKKGKHIITSAVEHKAVLQSCKFLETMGFEVTYLPVTKDGVVEPAAFEKAIRKDTILASIMMANNEIGTVQPVKELAAIARKHDVIMHTDAVQALGKMKIDVSDLGVHLLTFSGHKIYAPKGIGVLYIDEALKDEITPVIHGGSQEFGIRAGTESVAHIMALAKACELITEHLDDEALKINQMREHFEKRILEEIPDTYINGAGAPRVGSISNVTFRRIEGEALMVYVSEICCSTGSACTSESVDASHVLYAIGVDPVDAHGSLRFSFGRFNTMDEIDRAVDMLRAAVLKLQAMSPLTTKPKC